MSAVSLSRVGGYDDLRRLARRRVPRGVFEFVDGGAGAEVTVRENRAAFERVRFDPRWLTDVSQREIATTVLGERVAMPVLLAPAGLARLVHPQGELAAARAAGAAGTIFSVSIASSYSLEEIADVASGAALVAALSVAQLGGRRGSRRRAREAGVHALVLTVDVPVVGNRERDVRNGVSLPPRIRLDTALDALRRPRWLLDFVRGSTITFANLPRSSARVIPGAIGTYVDRELNDPSATWERLDWLRRIWDGPLVVKGVLSAARRRRGRSSWRRRRLRLEPRRPPARRLLGHARRAAGHRRGGRRPRRGAARRRRPPRARTSSRRARSAPAPASSGGPGSWRSQPRASPASRGCSS